MASSGMLRLVALVRTDVSEERSASFIMMTRFRELGTTHDSKKYQRASVASYSYRCTGVTTQKMLSFLLYIFCITTDGIRRMVSSGKLRRVVHVRTDVSEELGISSQCGSVASYS
jgi:hypothetical protein